MLTVVQQNQRVPTLFAIARRQPDMHLARSIVGASALQPIERVERAAGGVRVVAPGLLVANLYGVGRHGGFGKRKKGWAWRDVDRCYGGR